MPLGHTRGYSLSKSHIVSRRKRDEHARVVGLANVWEEEFDPVQHIMSQEERGRVTKLRGVKLA